jgi:hypothetical protein
VLHDLDGVIEALAVDEHVDCVGVGLFRSSNAS